MGGDSRGPLARSMHLKRVRSLRHGVELALLIWPSFFFADLFLVTYVEPTAELRWFLLFRGAGQVVLTFAWLRLRLGKPPGAFGLFVVDAGTCTALSALVTAGAMEYGGIASPLAVGVIILLVGRGAILPDPSKRAAATLALPVVAYPATLLVLTRFVPEMEAQLAVPTELAAFGLFSGFVAAGAAVAIVTSQTAYKLQQRVVEITSLGRYELEHRLGQGGMGEVWCAHDRTLHRDVALKLLKSDSHKRDPAVVARFEREARATADLRHPHTVRVFDFGATEDGTLYYAMELLDGRDLNELMQLEELTEAQVVNIGVQVCRSLAEAHRRGLVHRDVKPGNIFLASYPGEPMFVKLLDFGLAKAIVPGSQDNEALTRVGFAVGTPEFMAPEVLLGAEADERADLYSLGTVLFRVVTGREPFTGPLKIQLQQRMSLPPPTPSHVSQRPVSPKLEAVLVKAIQNDPEHRYQHAMEMAEALRDCLATDGDDDLVTDEITAIEGFPIRA